MYFATLVKTMRPLFFISLFIIPFFTSVSSAEKIKLMYFYEEGCHWCEKMDVVMNDLSIRDLLRKNTDIIRIDIHGTKMIKAEDLTENELVKKYRIKGTPTLIFFSAQGKELLRIPGALKKEDFKSLLCSNVRGISCVDK